MYLRYQRIYKIQNLSEVWNIISKMRKKVENISIFFYSNNRSETVSTRRVDFFLPHTRRMSAGVCFSIRIARATDYETRGLKDWAKKKFPCIVTARVLSRGDVVNQESDVSSGWVISDHFQIFHHKNLICTYRMPLYDACFFCHKTFSDDWFLCSANWTVWSCQH